MQFNIAPRQWLSISLLLMVGWAIADIAIALQEPTLGITWQASEQGLNVASVSTDGPAERAGIVPGMTVLSMHTPDDHLPLSSTSILEEPDTLENYDAYNRFFVEQSRLSSMISSTKIQLEVAGRGMISLTPAERNIFQLSALFWFQIACSFIVWSISMAVIIFRPKNIAARIYIIMGLSFATTTFCAAIYSGRELAIPGDLFYWLVKASDFSGLLLVVSFMSLLWHIPQKLYRFPVFRLLIVVYMSIWIANMMQWGGGAPSDWFHLPIIIGFFCAFIITLMQWYKSRQQPQHRLTLKWIMFSMLVPGILFVGGTTVLQWQQIPSLIPQGYAFGFLVLIYICISLGIIRVALFDLGYWWQQIWLWLLISTLFVVTDIVFVSLLKWHDVLSALTALSIIGFLYLPIRQWMIARVFKRNMISIEQILPDILQLTLLADHKESLKQAWEALLQKIFSPLSIRYVHRDHNDSEISDMIRYNIALMIPDIGTGSALLLEYADQGGRLFSSKDRDFVVTLSSLTRKAIEDTHAYQKGIDDERQRITSDIHDDLGAKLLSLVYNSENEEQRNLAREAINDLRDIIDYNQDDRKNTHDWLTQWRLECLRRAGESGAQLQWCQTHISDGHPSPHAVQQLSRVLREALSNALKHGDGKKICIRIHMRCGYLLMSVRNHGCTFHRGAGHGIEHMRARIQTMHGAIRWRAGKKGGCHVIWTVPMGDFVDS